MTATATRPERVTRNGGRRLVDLVARVRELGILAALAALFGVTGAVNPSFLSYGSLRDILLNTAIVAMLAVGQTLVVITRNVDLSVSSVVGLSAFGGALVLADHPGVPIPAYASPPSVRIRGMLASVSTLLTTVGLPKSPTWTGNGGLLRGSPRLPSIELNSAVSSPQI